MVRTDLTVLAGVGILALACLVVCGLYVYWSSDSYRRRKQRYRAPMQAGWAMQRAGEMPQAIETTPGTQLSQRCKTSLYRLIFGEAHAENVVFLMAASREAARKEAADALAAIHSITPDHVSLHHVASFRELVESGVSEDEDLRLFELAWEGAHVSAWADHPLFLTDDHSLLGKWAELYADLARELATSAINRARG
ncbi:hypothetical protein [Paraburkholderia sp. BCC1885]|uniref:hypothetical protein n=1 Tax=Paraburkholderia sp. BCC1885 TaxID=2562669 RepID=UPI0011836256|nr:hypothetical protein [Paraburkholderia sp. BCC1885]